MSSTFLRKYWLSFVRFMKGNLLFYLVLGINLVLLSVTKFYPTMDGPAHLHNSNLLINLLTGNAIVSDFYIINNITIPNWTSHILLSLFNAVLPGWLAEKLFLYTYIAGMAFSFRYFLKQTNPNNLYLSIFIFPFSYTFLFHLGFYNFCLSFIFLFLTLGYYIKNIDVVSISKYLLLSFLLLLCYYSNILIFGFLGLTLGTFIIQTTISYYNKGHDVSTALRYFLKNVFFLFVSSLPSLIFALRFSIQTNFFQSDQQYTFQELLRWIVDVRPLIVYAYHSDKILTSSFFYILLLLTSFIIFKKTGKRNEFINTHFLLPPLLLSVLLFFLIPDGSGAGLMSTRFAIIVYVYALLYVISMAKNIQFNSIILILIVSLHFGLLFKHLNGTIKKLDKHARVLYETGKKIENNSVILSVNLSDHWMELHLSNYIGIDKPIIILENYEASTGWFPVAWNTERIPNVLLGDQNGVADITWPSNINSSKRKQINNIVLYGNIEKLQVEKWNELRTVLFKNYKLTYTSPDKYVQLYKQIPQ